VEVADIEQGEVLWITPNLCKLPELDDAGFALRVEQFFGWDYDDHSTCVPQLTDHLGTGIM
jgi:hypothetical protein